MRSENCNKRDENNYGRLTGSPLSNRTRAPKGSLCNAIVTHKACACQHTKEGSGAVVEKAVSAAQYCQRRRARSCARAAQCCMCHVRSAGFHLLALLKNPKCLRMCGDVIRSARVSRKPSAAGYCAVADGLLHHPLSRREDEAAAHQCPRADSRWYQLLLSTGHFPTKWFVYPNSLSLLERRGM